MSQDLKDLDWGGDDSSIIHLLNLTDFKGMHFIGWQIYITKVDFKQNKTKLSSIYFWSSCVKQILSLPNISH